MNVKFKRIFSVARFRRAALSEGFSAADVAKMEKNWAAALDGIPVENHPFMDSGEGYGVATLPGDGGVRVVKKSWCSLRLAFNFDQKSGGKGKL